MSDCIKCVKKAYELASHIYVISLSAIALGGLAYLLEPMLLWLMFSPLAVHFWAGYFYGADHGNSRWTWRSIVLIAIAILQLPIVALAFLTYPEFSGFLKIYGAWTILWSLAAWIVGAMALVDDWM